MYVSYEHYRVFYYVAKCGNVTQAAKLLLNNQPNVTRTIKNLEAELGCTLFSRSNRGMRLTTEGARLYEHIRIAFSHIEAAEEEILDSRNLRTGMVYIAASEVALRCLLLPALKQYRLRYPGIHIRISNHSTPQAIASLKAGTADFAVVTTPTDEVPALTETIVRPIREVAVCSPYFQDLLDRPVSLEMLTHYPMISLGKDTKSFVFYSSLFTVHGLLFQPDIEAFTADQILPMVEADLGIGFVPEEFVCQTDKVRVIALTDTIPERSIVLIKKKEQPLSTAARELERMILEQARK